jgi:hypothetical protein
LYALSHCKAAQISFGTEEMTHTIGWDPYNHEGQVLRLQYIDDVGPFMEGNAFRTTSVVSASNLLVKQAVHYADEGDENAITAKVSMAGYLHTFI